MIGISASDSKLINILRLPLTFLVVLIHCYRYSFDMVIGGGTLLLNDLNAFVQISLSQGICRLAVPLFFIISGYLFFGGFDNWHWHLWIQKLKKRFITLFVPYILWNLLGFLFLFFWEVLFRPSNELSFLDFYFSEGGFNMFFYARTGGVPINYPLWFIRDLLIMFIFSPLVFWICKSKWTFFCLMILLSFSPIFCDVTWMPFSSLLFFSTGCYLRLHNIELSSWGKKFSSLALFLSFVLLSICLSFYGRNQDIYSVVLNFFIECACPLVFYYFSILIFKKELFCQNYLAKASFFIYATHAIMILPIIRFFMIKVIGEGTVLSSITFYLLSAILTFGFSYGLFLICFKIAPKTISFLTGGR